MSFFPRIPICEESANQVTTSLQQVLVDLIDLGLVSKQAHWNVHGQQFLSVHEKLDAIVESARAGADTIAERIVQLGASADGRAKTVESQSHLETYPESFQDVPDTLKLVCDRLLTTAQRLREAIEKVGELDPLTEDYLIAIGQEIEEHLWMMQAMQK